MVSRVDSKIRRAQAADAPDIARLVLLSAEHFLPAIFGPRIGHALECLAARWGTLFSHEHAWMAESDGKTAGMLLGYSGREKAAEDLATGIGLFRMLGLGMVRRLGRLLRLQATLGRVAPGEWYVSNMAVYEEHRGKGTGARLMAFAETEARSAGCTDLILDVETDHLPARRLYARLGYEQRAITEISLGGSVFRLDRMAKKAHA